MTFKNWPYWLRGGVIGGIILLISSILSISCLYLFTSPGSWGFECLLFALPSLPIVYILLIFPTTYLLSSTFIFIIEIITYFIIGSLIGALVGHIKKPIIR